MGLLLLLGAAGGAIYWSASCTWPAVSTDILSFLFYWVLLPHIAMYALVALIHPTVWYTKRSSSSCETAAENSRKGNEQVAAAAATAGAAKAATATAGTAAGDDCNLRSCAVSKNLQQADSAGSTPSTLAGYSAAAAATPMTTPPASLSAAASPTAAAVVSPSACLTLFKENEAAAAAEVQEKDAASSLCRSKSAASSAAAAASAAASTATAAAAAAPAAVERQLPLKTRVLSFVITRLLCLLLLTCAYLNVFCLLHLQRVWFWYLPYACWCVFLAETYGCPTGFSIRTVRKSWCWKYLGEYFPLVLLKANSKAVYPSNTNYLFGFHPHGILSLSYTGQFGGDSGRPENDISRLLPGLTFRLTTLELNMRLPFLRHVMQALGFVACSKENLLAILNSEEKGKAIALVVGGAREALCTRAGGNDLILKRRRGFFELALRTGASLVPVYSLGENDVYNVIDPESPYPKLLSETTMKLFGFAVPIFFGRGVLQMFMPLRVPVYTMIGEPLRCPRIENPSEEDIHKLRHRYCEELQRLYNQLKDVYRPKREFEDLRFVE